MTKEYSPERIGRFDPKLSNNWAFTEATEENRVKLTAGTGTRGNLADRAGRISMLLQSRLEKIPLDRIADVFKELKVPRVAAILSEATKGIRESYGIRLLHQMDFFIFRIRA